MLNLFTFTCSSNRHHGIIFIGANTRNNLARFDTASQQFVPYLSAIKTAGRTELAHTKQQVAWISTTDQTLWRGNVDGGQPAAIDIGPDAGLYDALVPRRQQTGFRWKDVWCPGSSMSSRTAARPEPILEDTRNAADPDWSPDGTQIVFGRLPEYLGEVAVPKKSTC
jgi:hypothetical protein